MSEKVYRVEDSCWIEVPEGRSGGTSYVMTNHPETGEICYRECNRTEVEEFKRAAEEYAARPVRPKAKSLRELVTELQTRIAELEKRG